MFAKLNPLYKSLFGSFLKKILASCAVMSETVVKQSLYIARAFSD